MKKFHAVAILALLFLVCREASAQQFGDLNGWVLSNTVTLPAGAWLDATGSGTTTGDAIKVPSAPTNTGGQFLIFGTIAIGKNGWMLAAMVTFGTYDQTVCTEWNAQETAMTNCTYGPTGVAGQWAMQSWIVNPKTYQMFAGPSVQVTSGDLVAFQLGCYEPGSNGSCTQDNVNNEWNVAVVDNSDPVACVGVSCHVCTAGPNVGKDCAYSSIENPAGGVNQYVPDSFAQVNHVFGAWGVNYGNQLPSSAPWTIDNFDIQYENGNGISYELTGAVPTLCTSTGFNGSGGCQEDQNTLPMQPGENLFVPGDTQWVWFSSESQDGVPSPDVFNTSANGVYGTTFEETFVTCQSNGCNYFCNNNLYGSCE